MRIPGSQAKGTPRGMHILLTNSASHPRKFNSPLPCLGSLQLAAVYARKSCVFMKWRLLIRCLEVLGDRSLILENMSNLVKQCGRASMPNQLE